MEHRVKKGQKLVGVFYQEPTRFIASSLNILTRPMRADEQPETYEIETVCGDPRMPDPSTGNSINKGTIKIIES